ncbi:uncharacterized protein LOC119370157 [Jatropha curcas]|uniref:uncharacterized protein LOC119370157 n=1 Tax=Jatropha curcas TaxID=180498 RepID=UPI0018938864|nr:uncharacterized protein LOC119370157 [Jatropha curcas]
MNVLTDDGQELRAKGLCLHCKQPYSPLQECPNKSLRALIGGEDDVLTDDGLFADMEPISSNFLSTELDEAHFSELDLPLYSVGGISRPRTMKLKGTLSLQTVTIMIASGASHNFISGDMVQSLNLMISPMPPFFVKLGDGHRIQSRGVYKNLKLQFGSIGITGDFFVFPLGGVDIILGIAWLETLEEVKVDWLKMTMVAIDDIEFSGFLWELSADTKYSANSTALSSSQSQQLQQLQLKFPTIFEDLKHLPPSRPQDHRIILQPGQGPISIKPSRYGHLQKDEIEKVVADMLSAGIIKPSSSPVLLVKKKDGSCDIPSSYERHILAALTQVCSGIFDDILVYSKSWQDHLHHLELVFQLLINHSLHLNAKKCSFGRISLEYLGHVISSQGVSMEPSMISSILQWPIPSLLKLSGDFLGLTGYYRRFILNYGCIAQSLTQLLKKETAADFQWNSQAQASFDALKAAIISSPVLALPDFSKPFIVETDASKSRVGVVLMQDNKPITYFSKATGNPATTISAYENELMAVVLAIRH